MKKLTFFKWPPPAAGRREKSFQPAAVVLGVLWAVSISLGGLIALGVYVMVSTFPVYHFSLVITLITVITVMLGGMISGAAANRYGLVHGMLVGAGYAAIYTALSLYWGISFLEGMAVYCLLLLASGGVGGVIGVNLPKSRKKQPLRMKH